jgi:hypothetical protein
MKPESGSAGASQPTQNSCVPQRNEPPASTTAKMGPQMERSFPLSPVQNTHIRFDIDGELSEA